MSPRTLRALVGSFVVLGSLIGLPGIAATQEPSGEPLEAVIVRAVVDLALPPWVAVGGDGSVALVEPSTTLWSPDRLRALVAEPGFETRGLPKGVERTTWEALDTRAAELGPDDLPGGLRLRRVADASEVRGRDGEGRQRLVGAVARVRILEAWETPTGTTLLHVEVMTNGPAGRLFKVLYDLIVDRAEDGWVVLASTRLAVT